MTPEERASEILTYAQRDGRDMKDRVIAHIKAAVAEAVAKESDAARRHAKEYTAKWYEEKGLRLGLQTDVMMLKVRVEDDARCIAARIRECAAARAALARCTEALIKAATGVHGACLEYYNDPVADFRQCRSICCFENTIALAAVQEEEEK